MIIDDSLQPASGLKRAHSSSARTLNLWVVDVPFVGTWVFPTGDEAKCENGFKVFVVAYDRFNARAQAKQQLGIKAKGRLPRGSTASVFHRTDEVFPA
jgi:hypothetical protein